MLCHVLMLILLLFLLLTCCADCGVFERPAAYPFLCYCLHGRLVVLAPFPALFRSLSSARFCTCLFGCRSQPRGLIGLFAYQLPKPMFEFAFEGELLAFIVNGDRFVLLALLPRRKPRTPVSAAALFQPHHLTGTPIPLCALVGGLDFCFNDVAPHLHTMRL